MSCGKLHEPGQGLHLHAPGEEHHEDDVPAAELDIPEAPKPPGWVQRAFTLTGTTAAGAWRQHGYLVKPFAAVPAMECSEFVISHAFTAPLPALAAAGVVTVLGEGVTEFVNWRGRAVRPVRARTRAAVAVGGLMAAVGGAGVFDEWTALATLVAGAAAAGRIAYEEHKAHGNRPRRTVLEAVEEPPAITAGPDPRLVQFTGAFCGPEGKLAGARASFRELANGILFELDLAGTEHGPDDVAAIVKQIAKEFNITRDAISVEYVPEPGKHSENYCQVVIRKIPVLSVTEHQRSAVRPWDGHGTYDHETGCVDLGWFDDGLVTHFQFNEPGSGTKHTFLFGATGSGKTGTLNVLGCEAGLAKLCRTCGPARACPSCSLERIMAVWMGDAQGNGLPVWHGRADLSAAGPAGCLEMLEFASQVAAARTEYRKTMPWTGVDPRDGTVQHNRGKGWFDVEIRQPLIFVVLDEFQKLVGRGRDVDPVMRGIALGLIIDALSTWRKLGLHLVLASTSADTELIGDRLIRDLLETLNIIGHRADKFSASMMGLVGDMSKLPRDLPGAGLTLGYDSRPSLFATKFLREQRRAGELLDVRTIAGDISRTRLLYDPPVQRLMAEGQWGIDHRHQFTEWYGRQEAERTAGAVPFTGLAAVPPVSAAAAVVPQSPAASGTVPAEDDLERILRFLAANPGPHSLGGVVNGIFQADGTRMSVATVMGAAPALHAGGQAVYSNKQLQAA